ncbi:tetratricopeptide repeat protein [Alteromonas sp. S167]|uniref:tetratricopeptide repeat protein n=1 Tax=Alteromonas sp. S167 TaxID=3117402 RepID=UPI002FE20E39
MRYLLAFSLLMFGCASQPNNIAIIDMTYKDVSVLANEGNPSAIHALCYRHSYGYDGAEKNYKKAYEWCKKSAMNGNASSITLLAELHYQGNGTEQSYEKAFQLYKLAAELGHDHAQLILYLMLSKGQGVVANKELAIYWLERSSKNGNQQAIRLSGSSSI